MKKTIDTLVEDINNLFSFDPIAMDEKDVDKCIDTFGDMLKLHVKDFLYEKPSTNGHLRLSAIGKPDRQLWYNINSKKEESFALKPSTRIKFLYGYILEEFLLLCSSIAGHTVSHQQKEVEVEGIKGHQDAMIDDVLVDCKSSSGKSFQKFKNNDLVNDDPFGYIGQISAYAEANNVDEAAFLVIDKSTGDICLTPVHSMEMINADKRIKHLILNLLIDVMILFLMGSLVITSLLLGAFIVAIKENVGKILMMVRAYVSSSMQKVKDIWYR